MRRRPRSNGTGASRAPGCIANSAARAPDGEQIPGDMTPDRWREVEALFHAAQECPPERRAALLAAAEPGLRREVESLLAERSAGGPLDGFAVDLLESDVPTSEGPARSPGSAPRLQPG